MMELVIAEAVSLEPGVMEPVTVDQVVKWFKCSCASTCPASSGVPRWLGSLCATQRCFKDQMSVRPSEGRVFAVCDSPCATQTVQSVSALLFGDEDSGRLAASWSNPRLSSVNTLPCCSSDSGHSGAAHNQRKEANERANDSSSPWTTCSSDPERVFACRALGAKFKLKAKDGRRHSCTVFFCSLIVFLWLTPKLQMWPFLSALPPGSGLQSVHVSPHVSQSEASGRLGTYLT